MPPATRPQAPFIRIIVALVVILPYMIAVDFQTSFLPMLLVATAGFALGHGAELLWVRRKRDD